jgi:hypothetical protein
MSLIRKCRCEQYERELSEEKTKNAVLQSQVLELTQQLLMYKELTSNSGILRSFVENQQKEQVELNDNTAFEHLLPVKDSEITELGNSLTVSILKNGISGVCFLLKDYLEPRVVITNASSGNFAFKYNNKVVRDIKCGLLTEIIVKSIQNRVSELASQVTEEFSKAAEDDETANTNTHVKIIRQLNWIKKNKHELCKKGFTTYIKKIVKTKSAIVSVSRKEKN